MKAIGEWDDIGAIAVVFKHSGDEHVCQACRALENTAYNAVDSPKLPLAECKAEGGCRCKYVPLVLSQYSRSELGQFRWPEGFRYKLAGADLDLYHTGRLDLEADGWQILARDGDTLILGHVNSPPPPEFLSRLEEHFRAGRLDRPVPQEPSPAGERKKSWWQRLFGG